MRWMIVYFEQQDTTQPAEVFEDILVVTHPKLRGKLLQITDTLEYYGPQMGGGYIEKCHDYKGMWEIRVIHSGTLARELFGFDNERIASWLYQAYWSTGISIRPGESIYLLDSVYANSPC
jgi:hypothetical protein